MTRQSGSPLSIDKASVDGGWRNCNFKDIIFFG